MSAEMRIKVGIDWQLAAGIGTGVKALKQEIESGIELRLLAGIEARIEAGIDAGNCHGEM